MRKTYLLCCALLCTVFSQAQVTGIKTIGVDYATVAAAVTALNTTGVGAGGATIKLPAGYTETVPSGGLVLGTTLLNASLSAANPLVFQKSGAGINPALTAFTGGVSTNSDGIFKLQGTDYVTIDGISIKENTANTAAAFMEWGYALVNLNATAPFDGCQFVTIKNCAVTLDKTNPNGAFGIYSAHNIATNTTALTLTATGDLNSNNKFYSNTISNVNEGIWVAGFAAASPYTLYDQNNDVGGAATGTGNTINNMGVAAVFNTFCIYMTNQNGANASYNVIDNAAGGTGISSTQLMGVYTSGTTSAFTANNNTIKLTESSGTSIVGGIYNANTGNLTVGNNNIQFVDAAGSGTHYGIYTASAATVNINSNNFKATASGAMSSTYYFIYDGTTGTTANFNSNVFDNINLTTTGTSYLIYTSNSTPTISVSGNSIAGGLTRTGTSGSNYCVYNLGSPSSGTSTLTNNNFSNFTTAGTGMYGIYYNTVAGHSHIVSGNTISNWSSATAALFYGIYLPSGATNTVFGNTVSNISSIYNASCYGMYISCGATGVGSVYSNNINNLTNSGNTLFGLYITTAVTGNIYKNKVYGLTSNGISSIAYGMYISGGTTLNLYNNIIGNISTPATSNINGSVGLYIAGGTTVNAYYNTVNISGTSSGANFGSSAIYASSTPAVTLRNNIFENNSVPVGTGIAVAYRRSNATLTSYAATSNNNLFFAGGACASRLIFYDGTNSDQTLTAYKTRVTPRDAASISEDAQFTSTTGSATTYLHINPAIATQIESGAAAIATFTDDFDGDVRNPFTPDMGADEFTGTVATACSGTPVAGTAAAATNPLCAGLTNTICLSGQTQGVTGITYQWQSGTSATGPFTAIACANASCFNTGVLTAGTYYYNCLVTCINGGASATSNVVTLVVNPTPVVTVSPVNPIICSGFSTPLTASGAATYTWSPATGLSATTGATVTASPTATTTYTVIGVDAAGCSSAATTSIVTVNAAPVLATTTATPAVICVGSNSQLQAGTAAPSAYCTGTYSSGTGSGDYITNVTLGTINNTTVGAASPYYTYYNALNTNLTVGSAYTITGTLNNGGTEYVAVWIDYNQNGVFEASEKIGEQASLTFSLPFTVPAGALNGVTRMRVMNVYNTAGILPCGSYSFGEIEDYNVTIAGGGAYTYSWTPATFLSSTTIANPIATGVTATTTYTVKVTGPNGCFATNIVTVTIDPTAFAVTGGGSYCTSGAGLPVSLAGSQTGVTYQLKLNGTTNAGAPVAGTGAAISFGNQTTVGTYTVVATNTTTTCSNNMTGSASITLYPVVTVTSTLTQPSTCVTTDGAIAIALSGAPGPYTFAWTGSGVVAAAQNQTNLAAGNYSVIVTDGNGCSTNTFVGLTGPGGCTICPTVGTVTTNPTPSGCIGANITLTASGLTSMGNTYGIVFKSFTTATADPYTGGTVLATVPNGSLTAGGSVATATATFAAANNYFIYAILTPLPLDPTCRPGAVTNFIINPTPDVTATPVAQTICSGTTITTIAFSGTLAGTTYNWTRNNTASVTGIAASGTGDITGTLTNTSAVPVTVTFTITPIVNGCSGTPITTTVLVNPTPIVTATPAAQTICNGSTITTIVNAGSGVTGTVYNWTRDNTATVTGIAASGTGNISGALTNNTAAAITVTFTITPVANGCPGTPVTATVLVNPIITATATPGSQTICSGGTIVPIVLTGIAGSTFTWTRDNSSATTVPGGIPASGSGSTISGFMINTTNAPITVTFTILPTANGCPGAPITATVLVNPLASAVATPATQTACSGLPISTIALTSNVTGATYSWTRDNTVAATGIAASGTGNIAGTLTTTGAAAVTVTFTITPSFGGCAGVPIIAMVTINPTPTVNQPANQTLCNGSNTAAVTFAGALTGTTYSWTNNTTSIGLAATGTGNIAAFTVTNTGIAPVTATITVTPSLNGCTGTAKIFTITVNPTANVTTVANQTLCTGAATTAITFAGTVAGTTYNWTNNTPSIGLAASGTGNIASFTAINTTSTAVTATITVTPTATGGCAGASKTFTITVNGQSVAPTGATANNIALCGSGTADLTVQGGALGTGASWKWYSGSCGGTLIGTGATITGVAVSGTATFYVRAEGTCNTTTCASVTVTVNPQPTITLTAAPYTSLMPPLVTGITATITPVAATNTIAWFKDGVLINGATTNTLSNITVDQLGSYTARVTTTAGCTALSAPLVIKDSASSKLFILPNPNNGQFKIRYYTSDNSFGFLRTVTIYDSKGARVFTKAIPITAAYSTMDIDIRNSGKGVYFVVIGDSKGKELTSGKVVVQ